MEIFNLPYTTHVNKVIPKNALDGYTTSKQKKLFSTLINRIEWLNKLSSDTINLFGIELDEIQIIRIELKAKEDIPSLLEIFDKATPYHIIFIVQFAEEIYLSASKKHPHVSNPDNSVIDWTFKTDWFEKDLITQYNLNLQKNLDHIFKDFCEQILNLKSESKPTNITSLIEITKQRTTLEREIANIRSKIKKCQQFNQKVALNQKLISLLSELSLLNQ